MTLRHLYIFAKVVECGKMQTAAKELYIAQSAVSQAIADIEKHYNIILFERLSKKLYITPAGEKFLYYANHILALYNELDQQMHEIENVTLIRIGATITIGTCIIHPLLEAYHKHYPQIPIQIYISDPDTLGGKLLNNELDIALLESLPQNTDFIALEPFLDDTMVLVCSPSHPFAKTGSATLLEISKENYIARETSAQKELFLELMEAHSYTIHRAWYCNNSESTKQAVMNNYGITVISRRIVEKELLAGTLVEVKMEGYRLSRYLNVAYHKNKYLSHSLLKLIELCKDLEGILS